MALNNFGGAQPCQLMANTIIHAQTWHMKAHLRREQVRLLNDLNVHSNRNKAVDGLNMAHSAFNPTVRTLSSGLCPLQVGNPCSKMVTCIHCWLLLALDFGIGFPFSHSQPCSLNPAQDPIVHSQIPIQEPHSTELPLRRLAMVRHRMRSHHGGSRGVRACCQAAHFVDQPPPSASLPSCQANSPPPSPSHRPFPHNAF